MPKPSLWSFRMAWRDSRGSRGRLFLYLSAMILGVAALVAVNGFGDNLQHAVANEGRTLLGADLRLERPRAFSLESQAMIDTLGAEQVQRISFSTMAYFPQAEGTRLTTVRAVEEGFPFYGALETNPPEAVERYLEGRRALVDGTLLNQFEVSIGDSVRIGERSYEIAGQLLSTPREAAVFSLVSPRIYIPLEELDRRLLDQGSRATHEIFLAFSDDRDVNAVLEEIRPHLEQNEIRSTTVSEATATWEENFSDVSRYLGLVGFAALLLGSIGVASAVNVYIRRRLETVAVLRCLGAKTGASFRVYLIQAVAMGLLGGFIGTVLGVGIQAILPAIMADFLPIEVPFSFTWQPVGMGLLVGVLVTLLFALLPLMTIRQVSPLLALRSAVEPLPAWKDPWRWGIAGLIGLAVTAFSVYQAPTPVAGLSYAGGLAVVFLMLGGMGWLLMHLARRLVTDGWSYPWRQGLANLYRPNNQTYILVVAIGFGAFLILSLLLIQHSLLRQFEVAGGQDRPNVILYDVQSDQREEVTSLVREQGLPVMDEVPIVSMRLDRVQGQSVREMRADTTIDLNWAHRREYRSTYRDYLTDSEEVVAGSFHREPYEGEGPVPISVEQDVAQELNVGVNDTLTFDVQGVSFETVVTSLRAVDWQRIQTNFFVVFPPGVLEDAPQTYVILSRAESEEASAQLQQTVVEAFPNVSTIDLALVLNVLNSLFDRISYVIQFMALFSIITGLIVLSGAVLVSRYQRAEESVLLKTLGASRGQILRIILLEYLFLGFFAAVAGLLLAVGAAWALSRFLFNTPFYMAVLPLLLTLLAVPFLTAAIGLLNSRVLYRRPPLEVLRVEV